MKLNLTVIEIDILEIKCDTLRIILDFIKINLGMFWKK